MSPKLAPSLAGSGGRSGGEKKGKTCGVRQGGTEPEEANKKNSEGALGFAGTRRDRRPNCALALSRLVWWMRRAEMGRAQLLCFALLQAAARASVRPRLLQGVKEGERKRGKKQPTDRGPWGPRGPGPRPGGTRDPRCRRERRRETGAACGAAAGRVGKKMKWALVLVVGDSTGRAVVFRWVGSYATGSTY